MTKEEYVAHQIEYLNSLLTTPMSVREAAKMRRSIRKEYDRRGEQMNHDKIFLLAIEHGCKPFWHDGIIGPSWHCGCDDNRHACDQQCSMITEKSALGRRNDGSN